jgi:hypothetical protein
MRQRRAAGRAAIVSRSIVHSAFTYPKKSNSQFRKRQIDIFNRSFQARSIGRKGCLNPPYGSSSSFDITLAILSNRIPTVDSSKIS